MKIIDDKGRLFGLINLVDFLVLLFLLAMMPTLYFGYKIMTQKPVVQEPFGDDIKEIQLNCRLIRLEPDVAELISVGDKEIDGKGRIIGEIIGLDASEPYKEEAALKQRAAALRLKGQLKGCDIYYKDKAIDSGLNIDFETDKYKAIVKVEDDITKALNLRVILKNLDQDVANLIEVGDKEIDATGRVVAEIVKISDLEDNSFELDLTGTKFTILKDLNRKQISAEMMLRCQLIREDGLLRFYFKGKKIAYNLPIEFITNKYKAEGLLMSYK